MGKLKSAIATELSEYLSIRQMTLEKGTYRAECHVLGDFDSFVAERGLKEKAVTEKLITGWVEHLRKKITAGR